MEKTISTYTEKKVRLQLVRINEGADLYLELRFNRKVLSRFSRSEAILARYRFSHIVHEIVVLRDSSIMSKMTV